MSMTELSTLQGSGASKLAQVIRHLGYNEFDKFELATITATDPELRIKVDNMKIELDASDVVVAEHLTEHTRTVSIDGGIDVQMTLKAALEVGDRIISVSTNGGQTFIVIDKVGV